MGILWVIRNVLTVPLALLILHLLQVIQVDHGEVQHDDCINDYYQIAPYACQPPDACLLVHVSVLVTHLFGY